MKPLRFTGEWPPHQLWKAFPNWEYAFDEEELPGQDETTLRPSDNLESIDDDVVFTVGEITLSDGRSLPALLELLYGEIVGVTAFTSNANGWSVRLVGSPAKWTCVFEDWLPPEERSPYVTSDDSSVFPAFATSRLNCTATGSQLTCQIAP
jgi:hypothetical protein